MSKKANKKQRPAPAVAAPAAAKETTSARGRTPWLPSALRFSWGMPFRVIFLVVLVVFVWQLTRDRMGFDTWKTPVAYDGDSLQILGWIKASAEGDYLPFHSKITKRLGAPYSANWNDYAMYEEFLTFVLGRLTNWFDLFTASNIGIVGSYVTAALSFYACSRLLRHRKEWAMACALLFAFSYYNTFRGLPHLLLSYTFTVPLAVVSSWLVLASKRIRRWNFLWWFCLGAGLVLGFNNPYNLNMYFQLMLLALACNFLLRRRRENLETGILAMMLAAVAFILINFDTLSYGWAHGKNPTATPRSYFQTEMSALKPLELVMPPAAHHASFLGDWGRNYATNAWVRGEFFSPYLGIVGMIAMVWLTVRFVRFIMDRRRDPQNLPPHLPQFAYILLYSAIGGFNCLIGLCGILYFRASNRYSVFLAAICLLFAAAALSRWTRRWDFFLRWGLAALVLGVGLWDQTPGAPSKAERAKINAAIAVDRDFAAEMEKRLQPGTMVFQLPVMRFPEGGPSGEVTEYEMLRPYFFTKTLRFSFGSNQGRPRENWQQEIVRLPWDEIVSRLESYGFGAIYMDRRGVPEKGEKFLAMLKALGRDTQFTDSTGNLVCVVLKPAAKPELPPTDDALVRFHSGWLADEPSPGGIRHWLGGTATLSFFSEEKTARMFTVNTSVFAVTPRKVTIEYNGRVMWSGDLLPNVAVPVKFEVEGKPGYNRMRIRTDKPPEAQTPNGVRLGYALITPRVTRNK